MYKKGQTAITHHKMFIADWPFFIGVKIRSVVYDPIMIGD